MTTSKHGERTCGSVALLPALATIALAACSVIAPLEPIDDGPTLSARSASNENEDGGGSRGEDSSPPAKKKDAGSASPEDVVNGSAGDDDGAPAGGNSSRAGRSGGTRSRAGTGGSYTAGAGAGGAGATDAGAANDAAPGGAVDAGAPTGTSNEPACDPVRPQQPRAPLVACAAGQTCLLHEDLIRDGEAPTTCETAGSTAPGASCNQDADCTPGHFCDTVFRFCVGFCLTNQDCDTGEECGALITRFTIGTTGLAVALCVIDPLAL
jgi:hypothetical protein